MRASGNIWKHLGFSAEEAERIFEKNDRAARSHAQPL